MGAPRAGLFPKKITVQSRGKAHTQTVWVRPEGARAPTKAARAAAVVHHAPSAPAAPQHHAHVHSDAQHAAHVAEHGKKARAGSQFTPETAAHLRELGVSKLPPATVRPSDITVNLHGDLHSHALITWRDRSGKVQSEYSAEFHRRNAAAKWERVMAARPHMEATVRNLAEHAATSDAHAIGLVLAHTGLRVGSHTSEAAHGHFGVSTLQARHVTIHKDGSATLRFVGKAGKENVAHITDAHTVAALRARVRGKGPNDPVFHANADAVRAVLPHGFHPKDFRTLVATRTAEHALAEHHPPPPMTGNAKTDMRNVLRAVRSASTATATAINNTPAVARESYIHPAVFRDWAHRVGVPHEWIGAPA